MSTNKNFNMCDIPIPLFPPKNKKEEPKNKSDIEDPETKEFECQTDLQTQTNTTKYKMKILTLCTLRQPEKWAKMMQRFASLCEARGISEDMATTNNQHQNNAKARFNIFRTLLEGKVKTAFNTAWGKRNTANEELPEDEREQFSNLFNYAINDLAKLMFNEPTTAYLDQLHYMLKGLYLNCPVAEFWERFQEVNECFTYFPKYDNIEYPAPLNNDTVLTCLDNVIPEKWAQIMAMNDMNTRICLEPEELITMLRKCERMEKATTRKSTLNKQAVSDDKSRNNTSRRGNNRRNRKGNGPNKKQKTSAGDRKACSVCGQKGHHEDDCWEHEKNASKRPDGWKSRRGNANRDGFRKQKGTVPTRKEAYAAMKLLKRAKANGVDVEDESFMVNHRKRKSTNETISINDDSDQSVQYSEDGKNPHKRTRTSVITTMSTNTLSSPYHQNEDETSQSSLRESEPTASAVSRSSSSSNKRQITNKYANPFFNRTERSEKRPKKDHYSAEIVVQIQDRSGALVPARALLDTGTSSSIVLRDFVRKGRARSYKGKTTTWSTLGGSFSTQRRALIDFKLPELSTHKKVTWITHVDDKTKSEDALYDMIIGMDLMTSIGIYVNTESKTVCWEGASIPLKERGTLQNSNITQMIYHLSMESKQIAAAERRRKRILDADYSKIDTNDHVDALTHLSGEQKEQLKRTLLKHAKLFSGGLGTLNVRPVHLELVDGAVPHHAKAFPVPQSLEATTKKEMARLTDIGVFKKTHNSQWAAPTFVQPKKTGDVRILTDFRRVNAMIKKETISTT